MRQQFRHPMGTHRRQGRVEPERAERPHLIDRACLQHGLPARRDRRPQGGPRRVEQQTREAEMEAAQSRYLAAVKRRADEAERLRRLLRDAVRLERANRIRTLVAAVEARAETTGSLGQEQRDWIDWARAKADWIDPVIRASDPILDGPEPRRPQQWRA